MEDNKLFDDIIKEDIKKKSTSKEKKTKKFSEKIYTDNEIFVKDIVTEVIPKDKFEEESLRSDEKAVEMIFDKTKVLIMKLVKENPRMTVDEIAQEIGITRQDTIDNLRSLIAKHMVLRVEDTESGHWETTYHYRDMY